MATTRSVNPKLTAPSQLKTTIAGQLSAASLAINNTVGDAELQALVAVYGYTAVKIQQGQALYSAAADAVNIQNVAAGAQRQATLQARAAEQSARHLPGAGPGRPRRVHARYGGAGDTWVGRLRAARRG